MTTDVQTGEQFGRHFKLTLRSTSDSLDLSDFRVRFEVRQADNGTPNTAAVRIYNLTSSTISQIINSFTGIILEAGYQQGFKGTIFVGDIKQYRFGKENQTDRYLDLFAGDGDLWYVSATMKTQLPAKYPASQELNTIIQSTSQQITDKAAKIVGSDTSAITNLDAGVFGGIFPRGRVLYGMARDILQEYSRTQNCRWYIKNGVVVLVPNSGYVPSALEVTLNGNTGLVGTPQATNEGVQLRCLLNPNIQLGCRLKLNNDEIAQTVIRAQGYPSVGSIDLPALVSTDGTYRTITVDFTGDTRGQPWYCDVTCLAINPDISDAQAANRFQVDSGSGLPINMGP